MIISPATPELVHHVALHMRDDDFTEISAMGWCDDRDELADFLAHAHRLNGDTCHAFGDKPDNPIAIAGAMAIRPGVWSVFMFATNDWPKIENEGTRWAIRSFFPSFIAAGAHRVECQSHTGHAKAHQWLEFFGFKQESLLRAYGANGEDFINYVWIPPKDTNARWRQPGIWR